MAVIAALVGAEKTILTVLCFSFFILPFHAPTLWLFILAFTALYIAMRVVKLFGPVKAPVSSYNIAVLSGVCGEWDFFSRWHH